LQVDVSETLSLPAGLLSKLGAAAVQRLSVFRSASTVADQFRLRLPPTSATFALPNGSLSTLHLSDLGIEAVPPRTFDGLTTLCYLYLNNNRLTSLPAGVFDDLCRLWSLSLAQNRFVDVADMSLSGRSDQSECGRGLARLRTLNLYGNRLRRLRADVFRRLRSLVELNLSENELAVVDVGAFRGLGRLRTLYMESNRLASLVPAMFDGLPALTTLDLGDNRLADVASCAFRSLTRLRSLRLRGNVIQTVGSGAWTGLDELIELNLAANRLAAVGRSMFAGLCGLRRLDLSENLVAVAPAADSFACLASLELLDLSGNALSDAERETKEGRWWLNDSGTVCDRCANTSSTTSPAEINSVDGRREIGPGLALRSTPSPSSSAAASRTAASRILTVSLVVVAAVVALFVTLAAATHLLRRRRAVFDCRQHRSHHSAQSYPGTACTLDSSVEGLYVKYRT